MLQAIKEAYGEKIRQQAAELLAACRKGGNCGDILLYVDENTVAYIGSVLTNHSATIDEMLDIIGVDMDAFADAMCWDGWNFENIYVFDRKEVQTL